MKKLVSFALAAVLCLGMTTTVMAANSPTTETNSPVVDNTVDNSMPTEAVSTVTLADGTVVEAKTWAEAGVTAQQEAEVYAELEEDGVDKVYTTYVPDDYSGTVLIEVGDVDDDYFVAYILKDGGWKQVKVTFVEGDDTHIAVTSDTFCPVAVGRILVESSDSTTVTETTSPKTADMSMALYVSMIAVVALGGVVYGTRKAR